MNTGCVIGRRRPVEQQSKPSCWRRRRLQTQKDRERKESHEHRPGVLLDDGVGTEETELLEEEAVADTKGSRKQGVTRVNAERRLLWLRDDGSSGNSGRL